MAGLDQGNRARMSFLKKREKGLELRPRRNFNELIHSPGELMTQ
jgi:hypothetical protein